MQTCHASGGAVAAANHLAASGGAAMLERGGSAVDAAIAAAAVMAVTEPHLCGLGGDLFAVVARAGATPIALNGSGRAGSGADPDRLRAHGMADMPFQGSIHAVTVPGFVDGLLALHERHGSLGIGELLAPARRLADAGFPVSPTLALASAGLSPATRRVAFGHPDGLVRGSRLRLPGLARALDAIATGRAGFYEGAIGEELLELGAGEFEASDLSASGAEWVDPLQLRALGRTLWSAPPNSQGYLVLAGAWIAEAAGIPADPGDERWAFTLIEAARQAAFDRVGVLHEGADGRALLAEGRLAPRAAAIGERVSEGLADVHRAGDTTAICTADAARSGVSLIMSNGSGFGSKLALPGHGIFLHNRGFGFSLEAGSPAEYRPRRRPPHTLTPLVLTDAEGELDTVLGTMGGDGQPQILLQLLARLLVGGESPGSAIDAPRWVLGRHDDPTSFRLWHSALPPIVRLEHGAPAAWRDGLQRRGYEVAESGPGDQLFGHAHVIRIDGEGILSGAADRRSGAGGFAGV